MAAVKAVSVVPNGIYGVDMAYDRNGVPNPTEINISRFFTTIQFFTEAGLNMPKILRDLALYGRRPTLHKKLNPLPDGLLWLRAMDCRPLLTTREKIEKELLRPF
jgi:carbamoyl-phosphate synthase large subunit